MSRSNILFLVIGALVVVVAVLGYQLYEDRKKPEGFNINLGTAGPNEGLKPDVSTPEALKRTLLAAKVVLITDPATGGISGVHFMDVLNKPGIAEEMKSRLVPQPGGVFHAWRVVKGEADLAVQAEHEIRCVKGAMFLPYPAVFQQTILFMGGIGSASVNVAAAKAYLHYVTGSETDNTY